MASFCCMLIKVRRHNMGTRGEKRLSEEEKRKKSEAIQRIVFPLASSVVASVAKVLMEHLITRGV